MSPGLGNNDHEELKKILLENQRLLIENNQMLYRMRRSASLTAVLRFLWFIIVISSLIYGYLVYIKPNLEAIQDKLLYIEQLTGDSSTLDKLYEAGWLKPQAE